MLIEMLAVITNRNVIVGLITAIVAGVGVKIVDIILNRGEYKVDEAQQLREELRGEARVLSEEVMRLQSELDKQNEAYFSLLVKYEKLKYDYDVLKLELDE